MGPVCEELLSMGKAVTGGRAEIPGPLTQEEACPSEINRLAPEDSVALSASPCKKVPRWRGCCEQYQRRGAIVLFVEKE